MERRKKTEGRTVQVGINSLLLIFIVLCLAVFGVLSLSTASADGKLAQKNADKVQAYYVADGKGEEWLKEVNGKITEAAGKAVDDVIYEQMLKGLFGEQYDSGTGIVSCQIPVNEQQSLSIGVEREDREAAKAQEKNYRIDYWLVINTQDYVIDESIRVWSGGEL